MQTNHLIAMLAVGLVATPTVLAIGAVDDAEYAAARAMGASDLDNDGVLDHEDATPTGILDISRNTLFVEDFVVEFRLTDLEPNQAHDITYVFTGPAGDAITMTVHVGDVLNCWQETIRYSILNGIVYTTEVGGLDVTHTGDIIGAAAGGSWHIESPDNDHTVAVRLYTDDGVRKNFQTQGESGYTGAMTPGSHGSNVAPAMDEYGYLLDSVPRDLDSDEDGTPDYLDALPLNPDRS